MNSNNPRSIDFSYKKYSLEQLDNWVNDALNCEDLTPEDIYDTIVNVVDESVEYHKKYLTKSIQLLSLLKGQHEVDFGVGNDKPYDGWDYTEMPNTPHRVCDKDDTSPECKKDWVDFWEETYYPEKSHYYTEEELNAMCDAASEQEEKDKCREYNMREAEYYNKRAQLDAEYNAIRAVGGYEWTPEPLKDEPKKWTLPVQQSTVDGVDDYYIEFPDDLLKAANLKEGDTIEWIDRKDGTYQLRKITRPIRMDEC